MLPILGNVSHPILKYASQTHGVCSLLLSHICFILELSLAWLTIFKHPSSLRIAWNMIWGLCTPISSSFELIEKAQRDLLRPYRNKPHFPSAIHKCESKNMFWKVLGCCQWSPWRSSQVLLKTCGCVLRHRVSWSGFFSTCLGKERLSTGSNWLLARSNLTCRAV